jgi:iron complex transport system permease protein
MARHPDGGERRPVAAGSWYAVSLGRAVSFRIDRRALPIMLLLLLALAATAVVSVGRGDFPIAPLDVIRAALGLPGARADHTLVVQEFRLPRIVLAALVGGALALSGAILQGVTRNALAEPGILGITNGAALTAVALIVWVDGAHHALLPVAAFVGGLVTAVLIYLVAWRDGSSPLRLILIGIGFSAVAASLTTFMTVFGRIDRVQQAYVWLAGSVYGRGWEHVGTIGAWLIVLVPLALLSARALNALALGDEAARGLGIRLERTRAGLVGLSVALAAAAVAAAGTVAFVGLVAPHITRRLVGVGHEGLLPASFLTGALMVVLADFIGRTVIAPNQIPAGIVTALIGAPYFMVLLWRHRDR